MQSASSIPSSRQLAATPTSEFAFSSSSPAHGGGQGEGGRTPPNFPKFNLPDSFWSQYRAGQVANRLWEAPGFTELIAQHVAASNAGTVEQLKALDPKDMTFHIIFSPIQIPDLSLSAEALSKLIVLQKLDDAEPQPQSSTFSASPATAAATQQNAATAGCCILPGCNIL